MTMQTKTIPLSQGKVALVDAEDFDRLSEFKWCASKNGAHYYYAMSLTPAVKGIAHRVMMHREVLRLKRGDGKLVDHMNHDTLDNRKSNLRVCTPEQNTRNRRPHRGSSSRYKGVSWQESRKKWMAGIRVDGKSKNLGRFDTELEAAEAYDVVAKEYYGEFAYLNIKKGATDASAGEADNTD